MFRRIVKEVNAEFDADEKYLDSIQLTVRESCVAVGMSRKDTTAVLLAIEEGATNIIRHAYLYEKGSIRLRIVIYRKLVVFSLIDHGRSYQPDDSGAIDLDRLVESGRRGGLGFYMIQKIMDSVEYISSAGFNELRMIKRIHRHRTGALPMMRRMSTLRAKFSFWTFLIVAVIVAGAYWFIDRQTSRQMYSRLDDTVASLTKTVADQASGYRLRSRSDVEFDELMVSYRRANPQLVQIILTDTTGRIIAHSDDIRNIRKLYHPPEHIDTSGIGVVQRYVARGWNLNYLMTPMSNGERSIGMVHVVYSSDQVYDDLTRARVRIGLFTAVLLLFGVGGIYLLSSYFVTPIVKITRRVRRFASGDLESELPLEGAEEFFEISRALNEMTTRLRQDRQNVVAREKLAKEIEVASQIQKTLLPHGLPEIPGLEIDAFYRAASIVGGDLYDVFAVAPDRYCLVVADVSGKGVPASLVMSMLRTVIQIHAGKATSAKQILTKVHGYLQSNIPPGIFITVQLAVYDSVTRVMNMVSAGHNPLLWYRVETQEVAQVNPPGMPLGVPVTLGLTFNERLQEVSLKLREGDLFLAFTDGVTEAVNREGRQFGLKRLVGFVADRAVQGRADSISSLSRSLVDSLEDFSGFAKPHDDISFIVGRCIALSQSPPPGTRPGSAPEESDLTVEIIDEREPGDSVGPG
jgi:serine phosphatase RsbU (regulator of sigma subunit)/anti-sigma regulatory factor (Ser/Thr protein kinase)